MTGRVAGGSILTARRVRLLCAVTVASAAVTAPGLAATIAGHDTDDTLVGTRGADTLLGLAGNDRLRGGPGADVLDGGPGSDDLAGGPGRDAVVHTGTGPIAVTVDDLANDGMAGEQDNVQTDVEDVFATPGDDRLIGSAGPESLDAGDGADWLDGQGGRDELFAGNGDDRLQARDGARDSVDCGSGADIAVVDELDRTQGCEIIDRRAAVPRVDATLTYEWRGAGPDTVYTRLRISDIAPARATVELRCSGGGCVFGRRSRASRGSRVRLTRAVRGLVAAPGTRLEVRLTAPGHVGKQFVLVARRHDAPLRRERGLPVSGT